MARKPRQQRLREATLLLASYKSAGLSDDYQARFIRDMVARLTSTRNLTSKQKNWLDSLIIEGVPAPKGDLALIKRMEKALEVDGVGHIEGPITDFLGRERKGWDISGKQLAFREKLLKEAEAIAVNGPWIPSSDQVGKLRMCLDLAKGRDGMYWQTHPADGRALKKVQNYFDSQRREHIDQWSVERLINCFRVAFRELAKPYASEGDMIWTRVKPDGQGQLKTWTTLVVPALIAGGPDINERGQIVYPVLADGVLTYLSKNNLMKRKPKEE